MSFLRCYCTVYFSDPSPKVTIEHRPAPDGKSASSNKQIKGSSRSNSSVNKGKGPAKKPANRPGPRSVC